MKKTAQDEERELDEALRKPYERRGRGQPTRLTPLLQKKICEVVELCNSLEDAAAVVGVGRTTVFMWQQKGREEATGIYRDFLNAIETAKARRRANINTRMLEHAKKRYEALAWLAERTDPKHFGLRIKVQVNEELERMLDRLAANLTPQEYERALQAISQPDDCGETSRDDATREGSVGRGLAASVGAAVESALHEPEPSE